MPESDDAWEMIDLPSRFGADEEYASLIVLTAPNSTWAMIKRTSLEYLRDAIYIPSNWQEVKQVIPLPRELRRRKEAPLPSKETIQGLWRALKPWLPYSWKSEGDEIANEMAVEMMETAIQMSAK